MEKQQPYWTWFCSECSDFAGGVTSGGMTTEIDQCPQCDHTRCVHCTVEGHNLPQTDKPPGKKKRGLKSNSNNSDEQSKKSCRENQLDADEDTLYGCFFHIDEPYMYNPHQDAKFHGCIKPGWSLQHLVR
jgi:hypothetical protein